MQLRPVYAILGLVVGAVVDVLVNLIAAGIQKQAFASQFGVQAIFGLVGLALIGLLIGYWLGKPFQLPTSPQITNSEKPDTVTITRLQALWSHNKLKGKGIHLGKLFLIGSTNEIDTE